MWFRFRRSELMNCLANYFMNSFSFMLYHVCFPRNKYVLLWVGIEELERGRAGQKGASNSMPSRKNIYRVTKVWEISSKNGKFMLQNLGRQNVFCVHSVCMPFTLQYYHCNKLSKGVYFLKWMMKYIYSYVLINLDHLFWTGQF